MKVQCVPLTSFIHGDVDAHEGRALMIEASAAAELERAGLLRIKRVRVRHAPPVITEPQENLSSGKSTDAGMVRQSSVSLADPLSQTQTLRLSDIGSRKTKARGG